MAFLINSIIDSYTLQSLKVTIFEDFKVFCLTSKTLPRIFCQGQQLMQLANLLSQFSNQIICIITSTTQLYYLVTHLHHLKTCGNTKLKVQYKKSHQNFIAEHWTLMILQLAKRLYDLTRVKGYQQLSRIKVGMDICISNSSPCTKLMAMYITANTILTIEWLDC